MTGWFAIAGLVALMFAVGAWLLRDARPLWTLLAAVLVFGLAGYAWQASPGYPSAPAQRAAPPAATADIIAARRAFFDPADPASRFVVVADGFARRGQFADAAGILRGAVADRPNDGEAWLALAVALVEHAEGQITPPATFAFGQARDLLPGNPAPAYFRGLVELRAGNLAQTRDLWVEGLETADDDAVGRLFLSGRLARLDALIAAIEAARQPAKGPAPGLEAS